MIPIPDSVAASERVEIQADTWRRINNQRSQPFKRAPIFYKLLKNPLNHDPKGLFKEYMRAFNDVSDVAEYEKPNKYNFKLTGVK